MDTAWRARCLEALRPLSVCGRLEGRRCVSRPLLGGLSYESPAPCGGAQGGATGRGLWEGLGRTDHAL